MKRKKLEDPDEVVPFKYSITSYGMDPQVDGLVGRLKKKSIFIPRFQRNYVWSQRQASRFIETLLLGLPVPGVFLSKEPDTGRLLVIDGQQRLKSLQYFYKGVFRPSKKPFELIGVEPRFAGRTYEALDEEDRRRLDDSVIHATVVRQDEPTNDQSSVYFLFERLNSGGVTLHPQQIRAAIYHGEFQKLLVDINRSSEWRDVYGERPPVPRDQELILRFFALYESLSTYQRPMKDFLNRYMASRRHISENKARSLREKFNNTVSIISTNLERPFRLKRALNAAVFDSVMVGLTRRLDEGPLQDPNNVAIAYDKLLRKTDYLSVTERATADEESVKARIKLASEAFSTLQ